MNGPGDPSAGADPPLASPAKSGKAAEGARPAPDLAGGDGEGVEAGEGGAAERPAAALEEPTAAGGLQPAVPCAGE